MVSRGERKSIENVIEETRSSPKWERFFEGFHDPYLHLTPEEYAKLATKRLPSRPYSYRGEGLGLRNSRGLSCFQFHDDG